MVIRNPYSGSSPTVTPAKAPLQSTEDYSAQRNKQALDAIAADYVTRTAAAPRRQTVGSQKLQSQIAQQAAVNPLDMLLADYNNLLSRPEAWETVGGPNQGIISALQGQRKQFQENYKTNRADANNLYGILTSDIEGYGEALQGRYATSAEQMSAAEAARTTAVTDAAAQAEARRRAAAAELGLAVEEVQQPADSATQEILATNAGAASNWANLLEANRLQAAASTGRQVAGATATKNQQLLAMKNFLDQNLAAVDQQIMMERSKSPTRQLTDIGKVLQDAALGAYEDYLNPQEGPMYSQNPAIAKKQQGFEYFGKSMANPADLQWYDKTYSSIINKISNAKAGVSPSLTQAEKEFQQVFGISSVGLGIVDPNLLYQ